MMCFSRLQHIRRVIMALADGKRCNNCHIKCICQRSSAVHGCVRDAVMLLAGQQMSWWTQSHPLFYSLTDLETHCGRAGPATLSSTVR